MSTQPERAEIRLPMTELSPLMESCLAQGQEVVITVTGNSMRPFLSHRRDQVVLAPIEGEALQLGDVPLYRRRNGQYVLHRVVERVEADRVVSLTGKGKSLSRDMDLQYTMLGDAQTEREPGIKPDQILAVAKGFYRRGRFISCASPRYRRCVRLWYRLLPWRRGLLFFHGLPGRVARKLKSYF